MFSLCTPLSTFFGHSQTYRLRTTLRFTHDFYVFDIALIILNIGKHQIDLSIYVDLVKKTKSLFQKL